MSNLTSNPREGLRSIYAISISRDGLRNVHLTSNPRDGLRSVYLTSNSRDGLRNVHRAYIKQSKQSKQIKRVQGTFIINCEIMQAIMNAIKTSDIDNQSLNPV